MVDSKKGNGYSHVQVNACFKVYFQVVKKLKKNAYKLSRHNSLISERL